MSDTAVPPTDAQMGYIRSLLNQLRDTYGDDTMRAPLNEAYRNRTLTRQSASASIDALKAIIDTHRAEGRKATPVTAPEVAEGHYALTEDDGTVKFYHVSIGAEGSKWEGFTFVDAEASDDRWPIKNRQHKAEILDRIAADPLAALKLYGQEIGCCGHCGRTLTSEYRKIGIGPVCIRKFG